MLAVEPDVVEHRLMFREGVLVIYLYNITHEPLLILLHLDKPAELVEVGARVIRNGWVGKHGLV